VSAVVCHVGGRAMQTVFQTGTRSDGSGSQSTGLWQARNRESKRSSSKQQAWAGIVKRSGKHWGRGGRGEKKWRRHAHGASVAGLRG
jgi:hypothetical protein